MSCHTSETMESPRVVGADDAGAAPEGGAVEQAPAVRLPLPDLRIETAERELIFHVLERTAGNRRQAALLLGINRSTLYAKLNRYEVGGYTQGRPFVRRAPR
jgi:DNA-binding NtrC family response regulator